MLKFVEKTINLPPLCSGNLPLVVHLLILIVLYLISYKHDLVNTLIFGCFKLCSSYEKLYNEIVCLKEIFDLCIKKFFDKLYIIY